MSTQHTPTPWALDATNGIIHPVGSLLFVASVDSDSNRTDIGVDAANGTFIVRACNSHDALVTAVRIELAAFIEQRDTGTTMLSRDARIARMRAALAAAEGK